MVRKFLILNLGLKFLFVPSLQDVRLPVFLTTKLQLLPLLPKTSRFWYQGILRRTSENSDDTSCRNLVRGDESYMDVKNCCFSLKFFSFMSRDTCEAYLNTLKDVC